MWLIVYSNDHAPLTVRPIYSSSKLRTAQMMIFSLLAMIGLEKCCITSACLQWLCHSGERIVARGPLVISSVSSLSFLFLSSLSLPFISSAISSVYFLPFSGRRHKMTHKGWRVVKPQLNQNHDLGFIVTIALYFQLYDNAMVNAGLLDDPRSMVGRLNQLLEKALDKLWCPEVERKNDFLKRTLPS